MSDEDRAIERKTGIPGMPDEDGDISFPRRSDAKDSVTTHFEAFRQAGTYIGTHQAYGGTIDDEWRLFYSTREPVGHWWVNLLADDVWDNWFVVRDVEDLDSLDLDKKVQPVLDKLKAKVQFPRETKFERRYGTSIFLLSYAGFHESWAEPLFELDENGEMPKKLADGDLLLQITPYPWTQVDVATIDESESSFRRGLPETYTITIGVSASGSNTIPWGKTASGTISVHWTRVILDAPRIDEHPYLGLPAIDIIFDDLVGGRNAKWGMYQTYYRHGSGFPVITTNATKKENEAWIDAGGIEDLMARSYFVCGPGEGIQFVGALGAALNPTAYFDAYFTFVAAATGVAKDTIRGVSAGRVTGSEVNERQKFKAITLQQKKKEPMLRELLNRLIQTGQVDFDGEYVIDWVDPFEVNPQDKAAMEFMGMRTNDLRLAFMTINEVRELNNLPPIPGGDIIMGRAGAVNPFSQMTPSPAEAEPEETEQTQKSLFDKNMERIA